MPGRLSPDVSDLDGRKQGSSIKDKAKKLVAWTLVTTAPSGPLITEANAETPAPADPSATHSTETAQVDSNDGMPDVEVETPAPADPMNGEVVYPTEAYAERAEGIAECRDFIKEHEFLPNLLDFGAEIMYTARVCKGFQEKKYKYPEKTKIGTYLNDDDVLNWVKTGEGWSVVWHKDENGNPTDRPAMIYKTADSDYQISFEIFQKAVDELESDCPGFLDSLCTNNGVVVFLQTDAVGGADGGSKFGWGEIYLGYNKATKKKSSQKERDIINLIKKDLIIEGFGNKAVVLRGDELEYATAAGVIKESLSIDWCKYMYKITNDDFYSFLAKSGKSALERYSSTVNCSVDVDWLIEKIKNENIILPYGVGSWEEVDKVIGK